MPTWRAFLGAVVPGVTSLPGCTVLKHSADRRVIRVAHPMGAGDVVCRWTRSVGLRGALDAIRGSAARRDFDRILALRASGVGTAEPLARLEHRGAAHESWLVTEFLPDAGDLDRIVLMNLPRLDPSPRAGMKRRLAAAIAELFATLQQGGWRHRDLKASNLLLVNFEQVVVVDLEGLRRLRPWDRSASAAGVIRLTASLLESPQLGLLDLARFLRECAGRSLVRGGSSREVLLQVLAKARAYNRAAKRRKTQKLDGTGAG